MEASQKNKLIGRGIPRSRSSRSRRHAPFASSKKQERRKIASSQIARLLELAQSKSTKDPQLAKRYAELAWGLSTRFNVRLKKQRTLYCHFCKSFLLPQGARYRLSKKRRSLNITCLKCGKTYHKMLGEKGLARAPVAEMAK